LRQPYGHLHSLLRLGDAIKLPLAPDVILELSDQRQDAHHELAGARRGVDAWIVDHLEIDALGLKAGTSYEEAKTVASFLNTVFLKLRLDIEFERQEQGSLKPGEIVRVYPDRRR
jgi:hypothetical protein